ncbi:MAG TPA: cupin-like domain-containing protein [Mycobacteriales bacterium]|nr:cupin-like domain-containing protein [Mycobacteriales bacterium]
MGKKSTTSGTKARKHKRNKKVESRGNDHPNSTGRPENEQVSPDWQQWAAQRLLSGAPLAEVIAALVASGVSEHTAATLCAHTYADPIFDAARSVSQQLRKINSTLAIRASLAALNPALADVERRSRLSARSFVEKYYAANRPVVITDAASRWPAIERWTPDYLVEQVGGEEVEVMSGRDADPNYEVNSASHKHVMPFDEYVRKVVDTGASNDIYLVANNHLLDSAAADGLWSDVTLDKRYLNPARARGHTFLWFGPAGTVTPLHHDTMNVMFHQVLGRKRITLISPLDTRYLYNSRSVYSDVRLEEPDLERFPEFTRATRTQVIVEPGEALFIPVGWWHHVEALDLSISVSSTAFIAVNSFDWFLPDPVG